MYLDLKNNKDYTKLIEPAQIIKNGGLVIFPTETVYGIGANGLDKNAIKKIYEAKQRPLNKPISLLVSNIDMIESVAKDITDIEYAIIKKFFPGPLTIILKKKDMSALTQDKLDLMFSHINSVPRKSLGGKTPYEAFEFFYGKEPLEKFNIQKIKEDEVTLQPYLLNL